MKPPHKRRQFIIRTGRIAMLNPLGDYGINQYAYELCEGLAENGVTADVYTSAAPELPPPRRHRRFHVLGSFLVKQTAELNNPKYTPPSPAAPDWVERALQTSSSRGAGGRPVEAKPNQWRKTFLTAELLAYLYRQRYDWVWTQWPYMGPYRSLFGGLDWLGLPLVHTVHNVLPHEHRADDAANCGAVYRAADALIVHSHSAMAELETHFPNVCEKAHVVRHPTYTLFPRIPEARDRVRKQLGLSPGETLAIACGAIRPYKNVDAVIEAATDPALADVRFVVAGSEGGYPDLDPNDPLGRTRALVSKLGVSGRFHLIPRFLSTYEMAELFEAADIVLLPYQHGYGSGQLMLAMTFGNAIVATRIGGADEYLSSYPAGHVISEPTASAVSAGIQTALRGAVKTATADPQYRPAEVAHASLVALGAR